MFGMKVFVCHICELFCHLLCEALREKCYFVCPGYSLSTSSNSVGHLQTHKVFTEYTEKACLQYELLSDLFRRD